MNDRFKFRAWNKKTNKMYLPCEYDDLTYGMEYANLSIQLDILEDDQFFINNNDLILMQCTELKDKNGTLIFEGDLLADADLDPMPGKLVEVVFKLGSFMKKFPADEKDGIVDYGYFDEIDSECYKVYGNIYANPELLKQRINANYL